MDSTALRGRLAELVSEATGGEVPTDDLLAGGSMIALGVDSLGLLRLVDAIELEYDVEVELTSSGRPLDTLDDLVALLTTATATATADPARVTAPARLGPVVPVWVGPGWVSDRARYGSGGGRAGGGATAAQRRLLVEPGQLVRVADRVDPGDPAVLDDEARSRCRARRQVDPRAPARR